MTNLRNVGADSNSLPQRVLWVSRSLLSDPEFRSWSDDRQLGAIQGLTDAQRFGAVENPDTEHLIQRGLMSLSLEMGGAR